MKIMVSFFFQKFDMESQNIDTLSNTLVYEYLRTHKDSNIQRLAEELKTRVSIQVEGENLSIEEVFKHKFNMDRQKIDKQLTNTLVYEYLRTHKNSNIQELAQKLKAQVPIQVEGENLLLEQVINHKFDMDRQKIDKLTNTLVYEYLRTDKNSNIQELAQKLKALVPIQVENENLSIEEVIYHSNVSRKILVPVRKKLPKQLVSQAEKQTSQKLLGKVSVNSVKSNEVLVPTQTIGPAEKVMPIKEVYKTLKKSEIKIKGKTEVFKALKYILKSDIKIMEAQADSAVMKLDVENGRVKIRNSEQLKEMKVKLGKLSRAATLGENSEESRIVKAWNELMGEAQITDKKQLIQDFDNLLTEQWPCSIIGMFVSKYLTEPRHALKVYDLLSRSVKQVSEKVQKLIGNLVPDKNTVHHSMFDENGKDYGLVGFQKIDQMVISPVKIDKNRQPSSTKNEEIGQKVIAILKIIYAYLRYVLRENSMKIIVSFLCISEI